MVGWYWVTPHSVACRRYLIEIFYPNDSWVFSMCECCEINTDELHFECNFRCKNNSVI